MGGNVASEHDACALVAVARKDARPTRAVLELVLGGMAALAHRSGVVDGEGDGAGVLTDIPRALWAQELDHAGHDESAVELERFAVGHFFHADPLFATSVAFGHNRYATNTSTSFTRVQPFPVFAHNGEINTISRLREEARALGLPLSRDGSDSQDVDAAIRALVIRHGLTAVESIELLFPPIVNEMKRMTAELQDAYVQGRAAIGPLAQGPAGILVRRRDTFVFGRH